MRSPNPSAMASRTRLSWNREGVSSPLARNLTSSFSTIRTMTTMINVMYKFAVMMRPVGLETASAQKNTTDIMTAHFSSLNFVSPVSRCTLSQSFCAAPNKIPSNHVSGLNMTVSPLIVAPREGSPNFNVFLAFCPHLCLLAGGGIATSGKEVICRDHFSADELRKEVVVDYRARHRRGTPLRNRPGARLVL